MNAVLIVVISVLLSFLLSFFVKNNGLSIEISGLEASSTTTDQLFQIFGLLLALGGTVGAFAYKVMKDQVIASARAEIEAARQSVVEDFSQRAHEAGVVFEVKTLRAISFAFFELYDRDLRAAMRGEESDSFRGALRDARCGFQIASLALEPYDDVDYLRQVLASDDSDEENVKIRERYVGLLNHALYHGMAVELLLKAVGEQPASEACRWKLVDDAKKLIERAGRREAKTSWHECYETAGLALIHIGRLLQDHEAEELGKSAIARAIDGHPPADLVRPSVLRRRAMFDEHAALYDLPVSRPSD